MTHIFKGKHTQNDISFLFNVTVRDVTVHMFIYVTYLQFIFFYWGLLSCTACFKHWVFTPTVCFKGWWWSGMLITGTAQTWGEARVCSPLTVKSTDRGLVRRSTDTQLKFILHTVYLQCQFGMTQKVNKMLFTTLKSTNLRKGSRKGQE